MTEEVSEAEEKRADATGNVTPAAPAAGVAKAATPSDGSALRKATVAAGALPTHGPAQHAATSRAAGKPPQPAAKQTSLLSFFRRS